jgi:hypothetical protein
MPKRKREELPFPLQKDKIPSVTLPSPFWDLRIKAGKGNLFFSSFLLRQVVSPETEKLLSTSKILEVGVPFQATKLFLNYLISTEEAEEDPFYSWEELFEVALKLNSLRVQERVLSRVWDNSLSIRAIYLFFYFKPIFEKEYGKEEVYKKEENLKRDLAYIFYPFPLACSKIELAQITKITQLPATQLGKEVKAFILTNLFFAHAYRNRNIITEYT